MMGKRIALAYLVTLTVVMAVALTYGFIAGDFWADGGKLIDNPWGIVSLFDVYVGFLFFIGWIACRESCPLIILGWSVAILIGGNLVAGIYALITFSKSKGDAKIFFLGDIKKVKTERTKG